MFQHSIHVRRHTWLVNTGCGSWLLFSSSRRQWPSCPAWWGQGQVPSYALQLSLLMSLQNCLLSLVSLTQWLYYTLSIQLHSPPHPQCCLVPLCCLCRIGGPAILWAVAAAMGEAVLPFGICSADYDHFQCCDRLKVSISVHWWELAIARPVPLEPVLCMCGEKKMKRN